MSKTHGESSSELLTKREVFALAALQGFLSSGRKQTVEDGRNINVEDAAVIVADRFIDALNKEKK